MILITGIISEIAKGSGTKGTPTSGKSTEAGIRHIQNVTASYKDTGIPKDASI
jgi:hypothetical protein